VRVQKDHWITLATHPEIQYGQYLVPNFMSASVALKIAENEFVLISPGASLLAAWPAALRGAQMKISIIMPNAFHYLGVSAWLQVFPQAVLYASARAINRLQHKGLGEIRTLEQQQPVLPAGYEILLVPGHRAGDVWLHKSCLGQGGVWITCDSFLNYARYSRQPLARFLQKRLDAAPGLKISQVVKWFILDDRQAFKRWVLQRLLTDKPATLIPSHGEIMAAQDLTEKLQALINGRL
jgi:hypothetical protein